MAGRRFGRAINKYIEQVIDLRPATREALFTFASQADLDRWDVFTDRTLGIGGTSTAELARCPDNEDGQYTKRKAVRTGICGMRTKGMHDGMNEELYDLQDFDRLRLRLRCHDPVHFLFNLRTDNWVTGDDNFDVFQAHIPLEPGPEWQEVDVLFQEFMLSWRGRLVEERVQFNTLAVVQLGISVAGGPLQEGRFALDMEWIHALRGPNGDGTDMDY